MDASRTSTRNPIRRKVAPASSRPVDDWRVDTAEEGREDLRLVEATRCDVAVAQAADVFTVDRQLTGGVVYDVLPRDGGQGQGTTRVETKDEVRHGWGSGVPVWRE
jgi:hypothetical protein